MASVETTTQPITQQTGTPVSLRSGLRRSRRGGASRTPQHRQLDTSASPFVGGNQNPSDLSSRNPSLAFRPASVAPSSQPSSAGVSSAEHSAAEGPIPHRTRGGTKKRRGGIPAGKGQHDGDRIAAAESPLVGTAHGQVGGNVPAGRQFVGRLTAPGASTNSAASPTSTLSADAPEFRPGQHRHEFRSRRGRGSGIVPPAQRDTHIHRGRHRRDSSLKSTAPDIATRTHEDIANGLYECPICTSEVGRNSKVWSCKTCWTVFHLTCIKKWSTNEGSTLTQRGNQEGELPPQRQWRCPGCNLPKDILPTSYTCWCEKEFDPRPVSGIPPHSCGQTCGHYRALPKKCPHPCELLCHAGPCPPCTHKGPTQSCFCGKNSTSRRCVDTDYVAGWSCGQICGDLMLCGVHTCPRPCHEGLCGACEVSIDSRCYCGKVEEAIPCYARDDEKSSTKPVSREDGSSPIDEWIGSFRCNNLCQRAFDCGKHWCERSCHPQDKDSAHCPRSPDNVHQCPCGKTALEDVENAGRQTCTDPIPNCEKQCMKRLACGHPCQQICHSDACMPCLLTVAVSCRCGRVQTSTICHQGNEQQPQCMRHCKATLNCGRHECGERCCPGERKASERQATKRKLRPFGAPRLLESDIEAEHICTRPCGRLLKCGSHTCPELCHKGPCGSCREAIFEEINCTAGRQYSSPHYLVE